MGTAFAMEIGMDNSTPPPTDKPRWRFITLLRDLVPNSRSGLDWSAVVQERISPPEMSDQDTPPPDKE